MIEIDIEMRRENFLLRAAFSSSRRITAIFGPSGAGKTSVVRAIAGFEEPGQGKISVNGQLLFDKKSGVNLPPRARRIGYVLQDANLFPHLSVRRNLDYSHWAGRRKSQFDVGQVCDILGISQLLDRKPLTLSGGEKQRVAIGRAILSDPTVLLLDEPLSALDAKRKFEILPFLENVRDAFDIPMVYISHSVDEVTRLADYLVVLEEGGVCAKGEIADVLRELDIRGSGEYLEAGSLLSGQCIEFDESFKLARVVVEGQEIYLPIYQPAVGQELRLRVKANDVAIARRRPVDVSILNMLDCEVHSVEETGPYHCDVNLVLGSQYLRARITRKSVHDMKLAAGQQCVAMLKAVALAGS